jgi:endonuclease/exonuclease/phosphatase family metal-dependent hydrolase
MKIIKKLLLFLIVIVILLVSFTYFSTFHPKSIQNEKASNIDTAPVLKAGQKIKVLNWNVQYMAGKNYVFYYDLPGFAGPDERPSSTDIETTFKRVVDVIHDEQPDVILLQEIDDGAKRTDYEDQIERLLKMLPAEYGNHSSAYYWKALFVPHPRIKGKVGMKMVTISKYKIKNAKRYQLPEMPADIATKRFNIKRCILETRFEVQGGNELVVLNTHLDAFAQGSNTMEQQVNLVDDLLTGLKDDGFSWLIGGDFNLLAPGQYDLMNDYERQNYQPKSELSKLTEKFQSIPAVEDAIGPERQKWFTQFPNDPQIDHPNKAIDYIFYSNDLKVDSAFVLQRDTWDISDHLPVIAKFTII